MGYTLKIRKIKQLKQSAGGRGDFNIARHFGRLKEDSNITFNPNPTFKSSLVVDSIDIIHRTVLLTCFRSVL